MRRTPQLPELPEVPEIAETQDDAERPSKSELKRQMTELQVLGEALSELSVARLATLDLPESLLDALKDFHNTRSFEGKRRQLQFVGKLMRRIDPEPVREAVAAAKLGSAKESLALHAAERWREEMLANDDALTRWINAHPETEPQRLRNLVRSARKDLQAVAIEQRHGRSYRELFQLVKSALAAAQSTPVPEDDADD